MDFGGLRYEGKRGAGYFVRSAPESREANPKQINTSIKAIFVFKGTSFAVNSERSTDTLDLGISFPRHAQKFAAANSLRAFTQIRQSWSIYWNHHGI